MFIIYHMTIKIDISKWSGCRQVAAVQSGLPIQQCTATLSSSHCLSREYLKAFCTQDSVPT